MHGGIQPAKKNVSPPGEKTLIRPAAPQHAVQSKRAP
jgi:hypothetical protein